MENFMTKYDLNKDKELMQSWLREWSSPYSMPVETWLKSWYDGKSQYLLKMFGGQTILEFEAEFEKSENLLLSQMRDFKNTNSSCIKTIQELSKLVQFAAFEKGEYGLDSRRHALPFSRDFFELRTNLDFKSYVTHSLISSRSLANNKVYDNVEFFIFNTKKVLKISSGTKLFRAINQIVKTLKPIVSKNYPELFTKEYFEQLEAEIEAFRLQHSQILNDKKSSGTLCLSIHPMDYMTMSDNSYGWTSCMAWQVPEGEDEAGCYHAGTVEMMTSPCVVVAYLKGERPWFPIDGYQWSNKKWRELFIVDYNFIVGVKGYPYPHSQLELKVLRLLAELAEKNLGFKYTKKIDFFDNNALKLDKYSISFSTDLMYNDFGYDASPVLKSIEPNFPDCHPICSCYNYSGNAPCTVCGEPIVSTEVTVCSEHENECFYCDHCDAKLSSCAHTGPDGEMYCEDCYTELFAQCSCCKDVFDKNKVIDLMIRVKSSNLILEERMRHYQEQLELFDKYPSMFFEKPHRPKDYQEIFVTSVCKYCAARLMNDVNIEISSFLEIEDSFNPTKIIPNAKTAKIIADYFGFELPIAEDFILETSKKEL